MSRHQLKRKIGNIERACAVETIVKTKPKSGASTGSPARNQLDRETGKGFLLAELRTGMTFAQLALTAHEFETAKIQRERANARKAFELDAEESERIAQGCRVEPIGRGRPATVTCLTARSRA